MYSWKTQPKLLLISLIVKYTNFRIHDVPYLNYSICFVYSIHNLLSHHIFCSLNFNSSLIAIYTYILNLYMINYFFLFLIFFCNWKLYSFFVQIKIYMVMMWLLPPSCPPNFKQNRRISLGIPLQMASQSKGSVVTAASNCHYICW